MLCTPVWGTASHQEYPTSPVTERGRLLSQVLCSNNKKDLEMVPEGIILEFDRKAREPASKLSVFLEQRDGEEEGKAMPFEMWLWELGAR